MARSSIPVLSESDVRALVTHRAAIHIIEEIYADYGRTRQVLSTPPALLMRPLDGAKAAFKVKGGHVPGKGIAGFRMIADQNVEGIEHTIDYCWVADADTGQLRGLVDETWLHRVRTALTGVVAAKWLARPDSRVAAIVGAGQIADEIPAGLSEVFDLEEVRIVSRRFQTASDFAERHSNMVPMRAVPTVEEALDGADIVIAISSASAPVLHARNLAPGMTICGLGGGPEIAADVLGRADRFIVDDLGYAFTIGSVHGWITSGIARGDVEARLTADIGEIATGAKPGRTHPDEIILAVIQGMACCDVALANFALEQAQEAKTSTEFAA